MIIQRQVFFFIQLPHFSGVSRNLLSEFFLISLLIVALSGCSSSSRTFEGVATYDPKKWNIKDSNPEMWSLNHPRIQEFVQRYSQTTTVETCLRRSRENGYLKYIHRVFYQYRLPPELAHLPMLESCFDPKAKSSTGALGLWQFNDITGEHLNMQIGWLGDDRLDWKKSTHAAAKYLDELGKRFQYDWGLTLAAYNGGPNYLSKQMKQQNTNNFWQLELREETAEYVPKFIAMLQVARKKYRHLYYQGAPKFWIVKSS